MFKTGSLFLTVRVTFHLQVQYSTVQYSTTFAFLLFLIGGVPLI
jgi:hypothetical protein